MPPPQQQYRRINLADLKAQIVKKIGQERSTRYFNCLNKLLSQKLAKNEFDKLCCLTLGRENLHLHNQLLRSVLKNAYNARDPPPLPLEPSACLRKRQHEYPHGGAATTSVWSNGDLPTSPRKVRTAIRDRRFKDKPSPLGSNGRIDPPSHQMITKYEAVGMTHNFENGNLNLCDPDRQQHYHHGLAQQPEAEVDVSLPSPIKRPRMWPDLVNDLEPVYSAHSTELEIIRDREDVEPCEGPKLSSSPLRAPLGIQFFAESLSGTHGALSRASNGSCMISSVDSGELADTETLKKRMEQIARAKGIDGVSVDCADLLNNGLDAYLKHLIKSCVELVGARSGQEQIKHSINKHLTSGKTINGVLPGYTMQMHKQHSSGTLEAPHPPKECHPISLLDFKVAIELNPQQLGKDWPLLLEKICLRSYEE